MTRTLIVRAEAEADLAAWKLWYDEQHEGLGARFVGEVDATFRRIDDRRKGLKEPPETAVAAA